MTWLVEAIATRVAAVRGSLRIRLLFRLPAPGLVLTVGQARSASPSVSPPVSLTARAKLWKLSNPRPPSPSPHPVLRDQEHQEQQEPHLRLVHSTEGYSAPRSDPTSPPQPA